MAEAGCAAVLVMGVSGAGKSTLGRELARSLNTTFVEADDFHPPANIEKMRGGIPLTDDDRWGWLDAIAAASARCPSPPVIACSALRRVYRDRLRVAISPLALVYLDVDRSLAATRLSERVDHFMPASLIESQFAALEPPGEDEFPIRSWATSADLAERLRPTLRFQMV